MKKMLFFYVYNVLLCGIIFIEVDNMQDNINKKTGQLLKEARKNKNFTLEEVDQFFC